MKRIVLIGAGNVGWQLGHAIPQKHYVVSQVYSRTRKSAQGLAQSLDCSFTTNLKKIDEEADIIIIAVKDDVIPAVVDQLSYLENLSLIHI